MERNGQIEIRISGYKGSVELEPENFDIRDLVSLLQNVEALLFPVTKKDRPTVSYRVEKGSVKHIITTSLQVVIGFNAVLGQIIERGFSIDFLESSTARAIEFFSESAKRQDLTFEISTSIEQSHSVRIDRRTVLRRSEEIWVNTELYFYGLVTDIGGKNDANVHLDTKEFGVLKVSAEKEVLSAYRENPLYKKYGLRALGRQNAETGEIDKSSLEMLELIDYDPTFDDKYLKDLIANARESWNGITDADDWLRQTR